MTALLSGLGIGLTSSAGCAATCAPVALLAVFEIDRPGLWPAARALVSFLAGRALGYLIIGLAAGAFALKLSLADLQRPLGASFIVLAFALWTRAGSGESSPTVRLCKTLGGRTGALRWPFALGMLSGIQLCPPLLMALGVALSVGNPLGGLLHFLGFFAGSSVGLLPLAGWPWIDRRISESLKIRMRTTLSLVVGFAFFCIGLDQLFPQPRALDLSVQEADLKAVLPGATVFTTAQNPPRFDGYRSREDRLPVGVCFVTSQVSLDHSLGYGGPVPVLVGIDREATIVGLKLLPHEETPLYAERVADPKYLARFKGRKVTEPFVLGRDVDAVTAATVSAEAVCGGIREAGRVVARECFGQVARTEGPVPWWDSLCHWRPILLVAYLFGAALVARLARGKRVRDGLLLCSIVVLGLVLMQFFSIGHIVLIAARQWPRLPANTLWYLLVGSVLVLTLFWGRIYCSRLCPFGALVEFCGRLPTQKLPVSRRVSELLGPVRFLLLVGTPTAFFVLRSREVTSFEPFTPTFAALSGRGWPDDPVVIVLLLVIAVLCVTGRRFWCRFLCPAGAALEIIARIRTDETIDE